MLLYCFVAVTVVDVVVFFYRFLFFYSFVFCVYFGILLLLLLVHTRVTLGHVCPVPSAV